MINIDEKYKYTGKEKDATGLYYFGARYYDPTIGRFITRDPIKGNIMNPQSLNSYVYCLNNPMKYIDPDGESPWDHDWLPDGDVEVDPATWDTFYDPELRQKYYDEWAQKSSSSSGRKHKSKKSWQDKIKDSFYFTSKFEVTEVQVSLIPFVSFSSIRITDKKTHETKKYYSLAGGLYVPGVQVFTGKANIENFEQYEGPFSQMSGTPLYGPEVTTVRDEQGKVLDIKWGIGWGGGLGWGYTWLRP
jgi:RHS repeat-associated protein